jgi:pimeloyl-ACP methyl ester carboxylesterase
MTVTDEYALVNGIRLHYRDWIGAAGADAPLLLLLHGFTSHARTWDTYAPTFTPRYRVVALDARGHGESAWAEPGEYGIADHVADVMAFLAALGHDRVSIVGISMGGRTAYNVAALHPAVVERLVVVDISPAIAPAGATRIQAAVSGNDRFATVDEAVDAYLAGSPDAPIEVVRHRIRHNVMLCENGMLTWRYDEALRRNRVARPEADDQWPVLESITAPTLLLRGSRSDVLTSDDAERMVKAVPDARLVEIADAGHSIAVDQPSRFLGAIAPFLLD